jgi:hypothetical protein
MAVIETAIPLMNSRRCMALAKAQDHADYVPITAGICDPRNGFQQSFCEAAILRP